MKHIIIILALVFTTSLTVSAKLTIIYIDQALKEAKAIRSIIIIGYTDSLMLYRLKNSKDTLKINCQVKDFSEPSRLLLIEKHVINENDLAGKWPKVGANVLLVINSRNRVSLFATLEGLNYRFWDPNSIPFANSIFYILKESHSLPLSTCQQEDITHAKYWVCTDGCILSSLYIKER